MALDKANILGVGVVVHSDLAFSGIGVALGACAGVQRNDATLDQGDVGGTEQRAAL